VTRYRSATVADSNGVPRPLSAYTPARAGVIFQTTRWRESLGITSESIGMTHFPRLSAMPVGAGLLPRVFPTLRVIRASMVIRMTVPPRLDRSVRERASGCHHGKFYSRPLRSMKIVQTFRQQLPTQASAVHDSFETVRMFREHAPAAVVLDLERTAQDGFALLLQLKTHAPACEIIMFTAEASPELGAIAIRLGADHLFDKVTGLHQVAAVVAALERARRLAEPVSTLAI
jgi:CheY-like chemotaxis protein